MSATKPPQDPGQPQREILPEEVKFDKAVYGGISYVAQAATGIVLTHWLKYGSGKPLFEKAARWLGPKIYTGRSIERAAEEISSPLLVTTMVMVGNTFLLPVKWLENHKASIVRGWTEKDAARKEAQGTPYSPEELARREKALQDLEKQPAQSWASLLGGRVFGLVPVFALAYGLGKKGQAAEEFTARAVAGGLNLVGAKSLARSRTLETYIKVGFLDVFYSMVSAGGLYVYSHLLHPKPKHQESLSEYLPGPTPASAIQDPTPTTGMPQIPDTPASAQRRLTDTIPEPVRPKPAPPASFRQRIEQQAAAADALSQRSV